IPGAQSVVGSFLLRRLGGLAGRFSSRRLCFAAPRARDQSTITEHAVRLLVDDHVVAFRARLLVIRLDQEPLLLLPGHPRAHQVPGAGELLALQLEFELALAIGLLGITLGNPDATVPDDDVTGA